jgi:phospholipid/cholesterol/gamma-HCH transport system substrate-binding protein
MSLEANRFRLGLFFTLGSVAFAVLMIWLTGWFSREVTCTYVCYFSESVQGLDEGGSVNFRGVRVGEVRTIDIAPDGRLIEVVMDLEADFPVGDDIAARLELTGITGGRVINLMRVDPGNTTYPLLDFEPAHPVIVVTPSSMERLEVGLEKVVDILAEIDVDSISLQVGELLDNMNSLMDSDTLTATLGSIRQAAMRVDTLAMVYTELGRNLVHITAGSESDIVEFMDDLHTLMLEVSALMDAITPLMDGMDEFLNETYMTTAELRAIMERLRDRPGEMLLPAPVEDSWR